jgi:predicted RNA-binding protein YlqC (UPF0109 family)
MPKPIRKFTKSLRELGEIQVNDWDFMAFLNQDIKEVEFAKSLRKLGNIQVTEWDFRTVLPAVNRLAQREVDVVDLVRRAAAYKVMDWDFRAAVSKDAQSPDGNLDDLSESLARRGPLDPKQTQAVILKLRGFLEFVTVSLVEEPKHAVIKVREIAPGVLRFKLVLVKRDLAILVGMGGQGGTAIRNLLKAAAAAQGMKALLVVLSHEEEIAGKML